MGDSDSARSSDATHVRFLCPHCGHSLKVDVRYAGQKGNCKKCNSEVLVPAESTAPAPQPAPSESVPAPAPRTHDSTHNFKPSASAHGQFDDFDIVQEEVVAPARSAAKAAQKETVNLNFKKYDTPGVMSEGFKYILLGAFVVLALVVVVSMVITQMSEPERERYQESSAGGGVKEDPWVMPESAKKPGQGRELAEILAYLPQTYKSVSWIDTEGSTAYVGWKLGEGPGTLARARVSAERAGELASMDRPGETVQIYVVDANGIQKGWRPGGTGQLLQVTARDGELVNVKMSAK